ncbi:MAG: hypothetical protein ACI90V_000928 [Bacillariaceae sp.]|jgi:hypothetical protein
MHRLVKEEYYLIVTASSAVRLSELNFAIKKHNNKEQTAGKHIIYKIKKECLLYRAEIKHSPFFENMKKTVRANNSSLFSISSETKNLL